MAKYIYKINRKLLTPQHSIYSRMKTETYTHTHTQTESREKDVKKWKTQNEKKTRFYNKSQMPVVCAMMIMMMMVGTEHP